MSKPIRLTKEMRSDMLRKISSVIYTEWKTASDISAIQIKLPDCSEYKNKKTTLWFSTLAYFKMYGLIDSFDSEVAWHGVAERVDGGYLVSDILVYPQEVTGATVNTDQKGYEQWLMGLDDETFNRVRFQGHSHVNMGVTPSGVDTTHQSRIVEQLGEDDFYIFVIANKKHKFYARILDGRDNIEYETSDIEVKVTDSAFDINAFINSANNLVKKKIYSYASAGTSIASTISTASPSATPSRIVDAHGKPVGTFVKDKEVKPAQPTDYAEDEYGYGYYGSQEYWRDYLKR